LNEDPEYLPDPLAFPKEVRDLFTDTKTAMAQELEETKREAYRKIAERRANEEAAKAREALRIKLLEKQAGESFITQKHSRWVAVLPFGVGQFQNGQRAAGWTFLAVEGVLLAGGIATVPVFYVDSANARATDVAVTQSVARQWDSYAADARIVNLSLYGGLALTALIGAIQAEVAFVPEDVKTEPRPLPEVPGAAPAASPHSAARLPFSFGAAPLPGRDGRGVGGASLGAFVSF
jgi:hypothetical protein